MIEKERERGDIQMQTGENSRGTNEQLTMESNPTTDLPRPTANDYLNPYG